MYKFVSEHFASSWTENKVVGHLSKYSNKLDHNSKIKNLYLNFSFVLVVSTFRISHENMAISKGGVGGMGGSA